MFPLASVKETPSLTDDYEDLTLTFRNSRQYNQSITQKLNYCLGLTIKKSTTRRTCFVR